jgi:hypothetical protein
MGDIKTKVTKTSVKEFVALVPDEAKRADAKKLLTVFKEATGMTPKLWGTSIIGYGQYHYKSDRSTQEGDWPLTGFSPRKQNLTVYIMPGFSEYSDLMKKLGTYKTSVSCLYIKRLSDINTDVLGAIIKRSVTDMKKKYKVN